MGKFKVVFYTKGSVVKDPNLRYKGGDVYAYRGKDSDYWSYFKTCDLVIGVDPKFDLRGVKMWWKHDGGSFEKDLKPFRDDRDASELAIYSFGNDCEVYIYTKLKPITREITFMDRVRVKGNGKTCDEEFDNLSESSDE
ncbi:unnamed protein product [Vicia faba]|uniref:PB1-like domain-containing protein n=1 Tax=Vicia faba TaxID=3906 RepID=A0AAV0ZMG5_VICFA|nr:unnamed protein product [Vicia faba]